MYFKKSNDLLMQLFSRIFSSNLHSPFLPYAGDSFNAVKNPVIHKVHQKKIAIEFHKAVTLFLVLFLDSLLSRPENFQAHFQGGVRGSPGTGLLCFLHNKLHLPPSLSVAHSCSPL